MTTANAAVRQQADEAREETELRYAMLSVYYRSLGGQLQTQGAPAIAVPPEVRPLPLDEALHRLERSPDQLWEAYWRIVRSVPVMGWRQPDVERRYPRALVERLELDLVEHLERLRQESRATAHLLAAALGALAASQWHEANALADLLELSSRRVPEAIRDTTAELLGMPAHKLVREFADETARRSETDSRDQRARELQKLPGEVGLDLNTFAEDFLDTVAFAQFMKDQDLQQQRQRLTLTSSSVVRQDTNSLTTTATITALVQSPFKVLRQVLDPLAWPKCSDVICKTFYLDDPCDLATRRPDPPTLGEGFDDSRYMFEHVEVRWGDDDVQTGEFRNVLVIDGFKPSRERGTISLRFRLCRSIDSRMLWDERAGGILIDGGYIVVRPVKQGGPFRMTARKVLRFSDRTPYSGAAGLFDFGQMLNYMTPAAVTWWLETDLCSARCLENAQRRAAAAEEEGA